MPEQHDVKLHEKVASLESSVKSAHHRIDGLEKISEHIQSLAASVAELAASLKSTKDTVEKIDNKVECLENEPKSRYETFIKAAITAIAGGLVGYALKSIGII